MFTGRCLCSNNTLKEKDLAYMVRDLEVGFGDDVTNDIFADLGMFVVLSCVEGVEVTNFEMFKHFLHDFKQILIKLDRK